LKILSSFFARFLRRKGQLVGGFLAVPLTRLADIAVTLTIGSALNNLEQGGSIAAVDSALGWIALYAICHACSSFAQRWFIVSNSRHVERELKQDVFDKLTSLSFEFHNKSRSGDIVSRLTSDIENVRMFLGPGLMFAVGSLVMVPVTLVLLIRLDATLALTMALPLAILGGGFRWLTPRLHAASKDVQEGLADISHRAQENFAGIRVVKGFAREEHQGRRFAEASATNCDRQVRLARERGLTHAFATSSSQITFVVILLLGGRAMIDGRLGYGDMLVFVDLTLKLFWPLVALGWLAGMVPRAIASAQRVQEILSQDPEIADPSGEDGTTPLELSSVRGEYDLREVSFTYPGAESPALSGLNLHIPAGSRFGVVGPTGCGKTTLLNLLGRIYDCQGEISLDGIPLRQLRIAELRAPLGYVPQDSFLFSDTWADNVAFGCEGELGDERLVELAELVCMTEELGEFHGGLQQLIGERGVTLSGGQRQRTAIARALARDPRVLILDDALSAVDTETERHLIDHLRRAGQARTVLIAAHRLSSVREAEQILVLDSSGSPTEKGTHEELLASGGWYARTWAQQQTRHELEEMP
jgi:ATP-binding cassette subfamily B multidrug efflux pump